MNEVESCVWPFGPGEAVQTLAGEGAALRRLEVPGGTVSARHSHDHEQFLIVTAGAGVLQCASGEVTLAPGVVLRLAAGAWHSAAFSQDTVLIEVNLAR